MRVFKIMSRDARAFRTTIGMSLQQFNFLMRDVEKAYPEAERKRLEHPGRVRGVGAGRPFSLRHDPQLKIKSFSSNSYRSMFPNKQILRDYAENCAILCSSANYESSLCTRGTGFF